MKRHAARPASSIALAPAPERLEAPRLGAAICWRWERRHATQFYRCWHNGSGQVVRAVVDDFGNLHSVGAHR